MPRKAAEEDYADIYREAAEEHDALAQELNEAGRNEAGRYVMAHYLAGLAVECILRAYHFRLSPVFRGRHDLQALYRDAQIEAVLSDDERDTARAAMTDVVRRWSNSHRYRSERALRLFLRRASVGQKGKYVRESSRKIVRAATVIVNLGVSHWNS